MKRTILFTLLTASLAFPAFAENSPQRWEYAKYQSSYLWGGWVRLPNQTLESTRKSNLLKMLGGTKTEAGIDSDIINTLGSKGWELVDTVDDGAYKTYSFKKPLK